MDEGNELNQVQKLKLELEELKEIVHDEAEMLALSEEPLPHSRSNTGGSSNDAPSLQHARSGSKVRQYACDDDRMRIWSNMYVKNPCQLYASFVI